ncbi:MAG TPA: extracellular solute-binding protein [Blastocatellia bacterium]|nr:extracellular solute-binding protein [Blastocatellia bacterium]
MRHATVIALVVALVAAVQACGVRRADESDGVRTITIWETYNAQEHEIFDAMARDFEREYQARTGTTVRLKVQRVPYEGLLPKLKYAAITDTAPDICRVDNAWVLTLAYGKAVVELDTLPNFGGTLQEVGSHYVPAAYATNVVTVPENKQWNEHLFGVPDQTNCVALFWNKGLFNESAAALKKQGLDPTRAPKTWDEFVRYARVLTIPERKQYGFGMFATLWWMMPFLNTFGASFTDQAPDGTLTCGLSDPKALAAMNFIVSLYRQDKVEAGAWQTGAINPEQGFLNGKYAMILTGPWNLKRFSGIDFGVALVPAGPAGTSSNVGGSNMVVFKSSAHPDLAYEFLHWFSGHDAQIRWSHDLGQIPVNREAFEEVAQSAAGTNLGVFLEQLRTARPLKQVPKMDQIEDRVVNPAIELSLKGQGTPEQLFGDACAKINNDFLSIINDR